MTKKELRLAMKTRNRSLSPEERTAAAERIFARVEELPAFADARCVALFCALTDEPPTDAVLAAWSRRKRVVVPRVEGEVMQFYAYDPAAQCTGAFGIAEPGPAARLCDPSEIDLVVVPGVAFTRSGARLGRGRGYYDKYLSQGGMRAFRAGVGYAHQLVAELPAEPHDVGMDCICTN